MVYVTHLFNHLTQSYWAPLLSWTQISHLLPVAGDIEMSQTGTSPALLEQTTDSLADVAKSEVQGLTVVTVVMVGIPGNCRC